MIRARDEEGGELLFTINSSCTKFYRRLERQVLQHSGSSPKARGGEEGRGV